MKRRTHCHGVGLKLLTGTLALAVMASGQSRAQAQESQAKTSVAATAAAPQGVTEQPIPAGVGGTMLDLRGHLPHVITVTTDSEGKAAAQCSSDSAGPVQPQNTGVPLR